MRSKLNPVILQGAVVLIFAAPVLWQLLTVHSPWFVRQERLMAITGLWGLRFLVVTLALRPAAELFRQAWLLRCRRAVGLSAFAYALTHAAIYFVRSEVWTHWNDLLQPYLVIGISVLVLMLPMAATSAQIMVRALGASLWRRLHQAIYLAAPLVIVHAVLVDRWDLDAWLYGAAVAVLLAWRLRGLRRARPDRRQPA